MTRSRKTRLGDVGAELDSRLGGLLGELGDAVVEALGRLGEAGEGEILRERSFEMPGGPVQAGIRVRVGGLASAAEATRKRAPERPINRTAPRGKRREADDTASAGPGGPTAPPGRPSAPEAAAARAIDASILSSGDDWTLVADIPGVDADGVTLADAGAGGTLHVEAVGPRRRYSGRFDLPEGLTAADLTVTLTNGILELRGKVSRA
jgi:HSP20 family molecular chaperone IbpA